MPDQAGSNGNFLKKIIALCFPNGYGIFCAANLDSFPALVMLIHLFQMGSMMMWEKSAFLFPMTETMQAESINLWSDSCSLSLFLFLFLFLFLS